MSEIESALFVFALVFVAVFVFVVIVLENRLLALRRRVDRLEERSDDLS